MNISFLLSLPPSALLPPINSLFFSGGRKGRRRWKEVLNGQKFAYLGGSRFVLNEAMGKNRRCIESVDLGGNFTPPSPRSLDPTPSFAYRRSEIGMANIPMGFIKLIELESKESAGRWAEMREEGGGRGRRWGGRWGGEGGGRVI